MFEVHIVLDILPTAIHNELYSIFGDQALRLSTVQRWFHKAQEEVENKERPVRSVMRTASMLFR